MLMRMNFFVYINVKLKVKKYLVLFCKIYHSKAHDHGHGTKWHETERKTHVHAPRTKFSLYAFLLKKKLV
jgi:hypothetical protein